MSDHDWGSTEDKPRVSMGLNKSRCQVKLLSGNTADESLFWIPCISTLIAGDTVYNQDIHVWLADQRTVELTSAWLTTLNLIGGLHAETISPGHSAQLGSFQGLGAADLKRQSFGPWVLGSSPKRPIIAVDILSRWYQAGLHSSKLWETENVD